MQLIKFLPLFLYFTLLGCSDEKKDDGLATIAGTSWKGQFKGAEGTPIPVSFKFRSDSSFQTLSLDDVSKSAKGEYRDMPRHSTVLMDVKESNFESFSLQETSKAFEYSLEENELVLKNFEGVYTLVKEKEDGTDPTNPFMGSWECSDASDGKWGIDFESNSFFGRRTQDNKRALNLSGAVIYEKSAKNEELPDIAQITLQESNQGDVKGLRLVAEIVKKTNSKATKFTMRELLANGKYKNNGLEVKCRRG